MKTLIAQIALAALAMTPASLLAQSAYTEGLINIPGQLRPAQPSGIDADNQIAGSFEDSQGTHGFLLSGGVISQIDQPGADNTWAVGINNVKGVVGYEWSVLGLFGSEDGGRKLKAIGVNKYLTGINSSGMLVGYTRNGTAFITSGGHSEFVKPPACASLPAPISVYINGINDHGDFVGYCIGSLQQGSAGFARIGGVDQAVTVFGAATFPTGINDSGTIAGWFSPDGSTRHGFLLSAGTATQWDFVGIDSRYTETQILGVNNKNSVTGLTYDSSQSLWVGFYALAN